AAGAAWSHYRLHGPDLLRGARAALDRVRGDPAGRPVAGRRRTRTARPPERDRSVLLGGGGGFVPFVGTGGWLYGAGATAAPDPLRSQRDDPHHRGAVHPVRRPGSAPRWHGVTIRLPASPNGCDGRA